MVWAKKEGFPFLEARSIVFSSREVACVPSKIMSFQVLQPIISPYFNLWAYHLYLSWLCNIMNAIKVLLMGVLDDPIIHKQQSHK